MNDNLDPEINPGKGVKRLNKLPLILVMGGGAVIALIMIFGIFSKAKEDENPAEEERETVESDESIDAIVNNIPATVPAQEPPPSPPPAPKVTPEEKQLSVDQMKARQAEQKAVADASPTVDLQKFQERYKAFHETPEDNSKAEGNTAQNDSAAASSRSWQGNQTYTDNAGLLPPLDDQPRTQRATDLQGAQKPETALAAYEGRIEDAEAILDYKVQEAVSKLEVKAGSVINTTLITGINSDLPGDIIAQVNTNVFDTRTGDYLLIPQGTKVIGTYEEDNVMGVDRVGLVWNRLIFPNGESLTVGDMRGADVAGYSGLKDKVNNHYGRIFGSALLLSTVGTTVAITGDSGDDNDGRRRDVQQTASDEVAINLGRVITEKLKQDINIEPTIEIRPGKKNAIIVVRDLTFEKPYEQHLDYSELNHPTPREGRYYDPTKGKRAPTTYPSSK